MPSAVLGVGLSMASLIEGAEAGFDSAGTAEVAVAAAGATGADFTELAGWPADVVLNGVCAPHDVELERDVVLEEIATATGLKKKEVGAVLETLTELAYAQVNAGFVIPGIGKLAIVQRKARTGRNPATGEEIKIPVIDVRDGKVRLGIEAPSTIPIHRQEVYEAIKSQEKRFGERDK